MLKALKNIFNLNQTKLTPDPKRATFLSEKETCYINRVIAPALHKYACRSASSSTVFDFIAYTHEKVKKEQPETLADIDALRITCEALSVVHSYDKESEAFYDQLRSQGEGYAHMRLSFDINLWRTLRKIEEDVKAEEKNEKEK
jgi:hypothetical protein